MIPVYKIEVWHDSDADGIVDLLIYTITSDVISVQAKEVLTSAVGTFTFVLPAKTEIDNYVYDDIVLHDLVKIWFATAVVSGNAFMVGRITSIVSNGKTRTFSGLGLGEILHRRLKLNKYYAGIDANGIAAEVFTDLALNGIATDATTTNVTMEVKTKTYFDILQIISDYWTVAGATFQKDFFIDYDNTLNYLDRPIRIAGVETLTVGDNILNWNVTTDVSSVKNNITVYGYAEKPYPSDYDLWTDAITDWSASIGTVTLEDLPAPKIGAHVILGTNDATANLEFKHINPRTTIRDINTLYFWMWTMNTDSLARIRILAPDTTNYFWQNLDVGFSVWRAFKLSLGPSTVYDIVKNPTGTWNVQGSPNWWDMKGLQWYCEFSIANNQYVAIDNLYFFPDRWSYNAVGSYIAYGRRDMEVTDDKFHSDLDCEKKARSLLTQLQTPLKQIEMTVNGNPNILVGDKLPITLPSENIFATDYYVTAVEHSIIGKNYITQPTLMNTTNTRHGIVSNPLKMVTYLNKMMHDAGMDIKKIS